MHTLSCGGVLTFVAEMGKCQYTVRMAHLGPNRIIPRQPTRRRVPYSATFLLEESGGVTSPGGIKDAAAIGPREEEEEDGRDACIMMLRIMSF